jgi:hypothetical protein
VFNQVAHIHVTRKLSVSLCVFRAPLHLGHTVMLLPTQVLVTILELMKERRVVPGVPSEAIVSLKRLVWPCEERAKRCHSVFRRSTTSNCVGLVDGTLLPLENKPSLFGENYLSRKCSYAVRGVLVVLSRQPSVTNAGAAFAFSSLLHLLRIFCAGLPPPFELRPDMSNKPFDCYLFTAQGISTL